MKTKSILTKSVAAAFISLTGLTTVSALGTSTQAATTQSNVSVYTTPTSTKVYNNYENPVATGRVLAANTSWKVIETAYDAQGQEWYKLGKNQWVKVTANPALKQTNQTQKTQSVSSQVTTTSKNEAASSTSSASGSEAAAKAWIASRESGGSYSAQNGSYVGKYQLSASYLHGDYSAANQERVADNYVKARYGSWVAAKNFWEANGYY